MNDRAPATEGVVRRAASLRGRMDPGEQNGSSAATRASAATARLQRWIAFATLLAGIALALWVWSNESIDIDPTALRERIAAFGWLAPAVFVLVAALRPFLLLPSWPIKTAGGLLFGVVWGIAFGSLGFALGAMLSFAIARGLGREAVAARITGRAVRIDRFISERGALWMALYTGLPVTPLTPVHLSAGLSGMRPGTFFVAVVAGFVPRTALFSLFGDSVAEGDWTRMVVVLAVIGAVAAVGVVVTRRVGAASAARAGATLTDEDRE